LIGGGLQKGKTYLVTGETGCGKTIFCLQYILHGLSKGENGVYITVDESPEHLVEDAESFGWDLEKYIDGGRLLLLDITTEFSDLRSGRGGPRTEKIISEIRSFIEEVSARRLVIDPVAPMFTSLENEYLMYEYLRLLIFSLDRMGTTNIITSYIRSGTESLSRFGVEEFFTSGIIVLGLAKREFGYERTLLIRKMRGTPITLGENTFRISEEGIWIV
jgi:circadian clock protein KaiC